MKRYLRRILISVIPTLLALVIVGVAYAHYEQGKGGFTLGVDLVGGTILVYEVDDTKTKDNFKAEDLAAALKRRIDPADLYNITIRPVPTTPPRVEIILPTGGQHQADAERRNWEQFLEKVQERFPPTSGKKNPYADIRTGDLATLTDRILKEKPASVDQAEYGKEVGKWIEQKTDHETTGRRNLTGDDVERIKELISRQGQLEFKILANANDDVEAMAAAREGLPKMNPADLERLAIRAEPPPAPRNESGGDTFPVRLPGEQDHTYSWVEIGKSQLHAMNYDTESLRTAKYARNKTQVEDALKSRQPFSYGANLVYVRRIPPAGWTRRLSKDQKQGKELEYFYLVRNPLRGEEITGDFLNRASAGRGEKGLSIDFSFNNEGGERFYRVTSKNKPDGTGEGQFHRQLAIVFDGQIASAPRLNQAIRTNGQITGEFTQQEVNDMVRILRAGALPATLKKDPVSENSMGPTLGATTIKWGTRSVVAAFVAVLAFMVFYYRFAGLVACVALFSNLLLTVAFMVLVKAAFTLPGLAGLVLMLGMAVDANVLIYERLREERERGASLSLALRNGYDRAFPTILDTHLSSIFTAIVLYVVGNDQLKGFGISLTVGLIISLFTSLYMTRTIFEVCLAKGWLKELSFFGGLVRLIHARYWDFMSVRYWWFGGTIVLTLLGAALFVYRADTRADEAHGAPTVLNIDFTGGTAYTGRLNTPMSLEELRGELDKARDLRREQDKRDPLPDLSIELLGSVKGRDEDQGEQLFTVRTSNKNSKDVLSIISESLKGKLEQILVGKYDLKMEAGKVTEVTLNFTDAQEKGEGYASPSQVSRLLGDASEEKQMPRNTFTVERPAAGKEKNDHYSQLILHPVDPLSPAKVKEVLDRVAQEFKNAPQPERLEIFDKQLAASTQQRALYAILASWGAILLYLWFRFGNWTFGAAAVLCLIHDLFFTLGAIALCYYVHGTWFGDLLAIRDFKIDLPAVAALLTLVGYSVNDTIVVFDRIREVRGKNPALTTQIINDSVNQTLTRTILASATVFVVVLVLYWFGGEGVKLFAFVMLVGVVVGTYSSIYIASPLLLIFGEGKLAPGQLDRSPSPTTSTAITGA